MASPGRRGNSPPTSVLEKMMVNKAGEIQKRGNVTARIKTKSKELLGYELDKIELRLMAYVMYVMVNDQKLDQSVVNLDDRRVLGKWKKAGHVNGGISGMQITKEFWDIICQIVFLGYVDID